MFATRFSRSQHTTRVCWGGGLNKYHSTAGDGKSRDRRCWKWRCTPIQDKPRVSPPPRPRRGRATVALLTGGEASRTLDRHGSGGCQAATAGRAVRGSAGPRPPGVPGRASGEPLRRGERQRRRRLGPPETTRPQGTGAMGSGFAATSAGDRGVSPRRSRSGSGARGTPGKTSSPARSTPRAWRANAGPRIPGGLLPAVTGSGGKAPEPHGGRHAAGAIRPSRSAGGRAPSSTASKGRCRSRRSRPAPGRREINGPWHPGRSPRPPGMLTDVGTAAAAARTTSGSPTVGHIFYFRGIWGMLGFAHPIATPSSPHCPRSR